MKQNMQPTERGGIAFNIMLALLIIVIGILVYLMTNDKSHKIGRNIGTEATHTETQPKTSIHPDSYGEFNDGLGRPDSTTEYPLDDVGAGMASREVFRYDINNDGRKDRITRLRIETGTSHFSYKYTIELNTDNGFIDITPSGFDTIEGAECSLQKIRFFFTPSFKAEKISRPWQETWVTPTPATRDTYSIVNNTIHLIDSAPMGVVCDVAELF